MVKSRRSGRLWLDEDFIELIAWLNYSMNYIAIDFADTVLEHLKASRNNEYTLEQVNRKLRWAWERFGPKSGSHYTWNDLYDHGSQILPRLTGEQQESIASVQARLEDEATAKILSPWDGPRTRSASKTDSWRLSPHISLETFQSKQKPRFYNRAQTRSVTPSPAKRESGPVDLGTYDGLTPAKKVKKSSPLKHASLSIDTLSDKQKHSISNASSTDVQTEIGNDDVECHGEDDENDAEHEEEDEQAPDEISVRDGKEVSSSDTSSEADTSTVEDSLDEESHRFESKARPKSSTERTLKQRLNLAIAEINELRQKLNQKRAELEEEENRANKLQSQKNSLQAAQKERDLRIGEPFEEFLSRKDQYIDKLKDRLADRQSLGTFTKSFQSSPARHSKVSLEEGFKDIYSHCQHIPCQYDRERPLFIPALELYDDLRLLVCRGLGMELQDNVRAEEANIDFSILTPQAIVRAVTTSALREWVFEDTFPVFDSKSALLAKYRESIAKLDGILALRNLDLAAHSSLIKDDHFRKYRIPRKARKLARRLSKALAPFFAEDPYHPRNADLYGFNTWGQDKEEYEERREIFENLFAHALQTKANSILNLEEYQIVIYPSGTEFNKETMEVEDMRGIPQRNGEFDGRVVELCIQAAVFSYPKRELGDDPAKFLEEALVKSRNFSHNGSVQGEGGRLLLPARVILRDELPVVPNIVSDTKNDDSSSSLTSPGKMSFSDPE